MIKLSKSLFVDLTYHILSHMHINHITDLYNMDYIELTKKNKLEMCFDHNMIDDYSDLSALYIENIDTLLTVNFLPYSINCIEEYNLILDNLSQTYGESTSEFYLKFKTAINHEYIYFKHYWEMLSKDQSSVLLEFQEHINSSTSPLKLVEKYFNRELIVNTSATLFKFGRGLVSGDDQIIAAVLTPKSSKDILSSSIVAFHEFTHYITDELIASHMLNSGNIPIQETLVMRFDFQIIKNNFREYMPEYLRISSDWMGVEITENDYEVVFALDGDLEKIMLHKVDELEQLLDSN